ncbi:MAG: hypothetical protein WAS51_04950 [Ilumatobacteraceae bacterium]
MLRSRTLTAVGLALTLGLATAACGGDDSGSEDTDAPSTDTPTTDSPSTDAPDGPVCPTKIVVQTDWWPELEHGGTYQLIGPDGVANKENFTYSGPIQAQYAAGGVEEVEIRAGGDAISFSPVTSEMYTKNEITFGYVNASDAMKDSATNAVVGVSKTLDVDPQMLMWDPTQLDITDPEDMAATGAKVLHFDGVAYLEFLISNGYIDEGQSDPSYGGAPDEWIAQGGNFIQQGFVTNEVFKYENTIDWKDGAPADVEYFILAEIGFPNYPAMMSVRQDRLEELAPCLEVLVPKLAQAWVDYLADPAPINDALVAINETYDTYWQLSPELNEAGMELLEAEEIAANSADGTYCSFDDDKVTELADILGPAFVDRGLEIAEDLTAVVDNSFCEGAPGR